MKVEKITNIKKFSKMRVEQLKEEFNKFNKVRVFTNTDKYKGIVIIKDIDFSSKCEHHLVSIRGKVHVGYIPHEWLVGLSQIPRIVEHFMNPTTEIIQETVNKQIIDFIDNLLNPSGIMVVIEAEHDCMCHRGVKQRNARTITSEIRGLFYHADVKQEFFELIKLRRLLE